MTAGLINRSRKGRDTLTCPSPGRLSSRTHLEPEIVLLAPGVREARARALEGEGAFGVEPMPVGFITGGNHKLSRLRT